MNKINLALTSDGEEKGPTQVHLNVSFDDRETAIAFHAKVAALCDSANRARSSSVTHGIQRLLPARMRPA
jgi:hypothetical protein